MNQLAQRIYGANAHLFNTASDPLRSHGPDHHLRVYNNAVKLAQQVSKPYDEEVLAAACLLHDLAAYYPDEAGNNYHERDHQYAARVLDEIHFSIEKRQRVLDAIASHGTDKKYQHSAEAIEVTLLRDADKLDVFGPLGIARIIMVRTLKGDTLTQIVDDFYTRRHLERKWESITFPEARTMAQADYKYARDFFAGLAKALGKS